MRESFHKSDEYSGAFLVTTLLIKQLYDIDLFQYFNNLTNFLHHTLLQLHPLQKISGLRFLRLFIKHFLFIPQASEQVIQVTLSHRDAGSIYIPIPQTMFEDQFHFLKLLQWHFHHLLYRERQFVTQSSLGDLIFHTQTILRITRLHK